MYEPGHLVRSLSSGQQLLVFMIRVFGLKKKLFIADLDFFFKLRNCPFIILSLFIPFVNDKHITIHAEHTNYTLQNMYKNRSN